MAATITYNVSERVLANNGSEFGRRQFVVAGRAGGARPSDLILRESLRDIRDSR
jgi:hypothetical protein